MKTILCFEPGSLEAFKQEMSLVVLDTSNFEDFSDLIAGNVQGYTHIDNLVMCEAGENIIEALKTIGFSIAIPLGFNKSASNFNFKVDLFKEKEYIIEKLQDLKRAEKDKKLESTLVHNLEKLGSVEDEYE